MQWTGRAIVCGPKSAARPSAGGCIESICRKPGVPMKDALKSPTLMAIARLYFAAHFGAVLGLLGLLASGDAEWSADRIRDPSLLKC